MASQRILATGMIVAGGDVQWRIAPPPVEDELQDGLLQRLIDEAEQTADYEEWLLDEEWIRSGC